MGCGHSPRVSRRGDRLVRPNFRPPGSAQVAYNPTLGIAIFGSMTRPPLATTFVTMVSRSGTGMVICVVGTPAAAGASATAPIPPSIPTSQRRLGSEIWVRHTKSLELPTEDLAEEPHRFLNIFDGQIEIGGLHL